MPPGKVMSWALQPPKRTRGEGRGIPVTPLPSTMARSCRTAKGIWHPLDGVLALGNIHDGHTWHLAYSPLQVAIAGGHNVALVLL
jgi:hypothetical protein